MHTSMLHMPQLAVQGPGCAACSCLALLPQLLAQALSLAGRESCAPWQVIITILAGLHGCTSMHAQGTAAGSRMPLS